MKKNCLKILNEKQSKAGPLQYTILRFQVHRLSCICIYKGEIERTAIKPNYFLPQIIDPILGKFKQNFP